MYKSTDEINEELKTQLGNICFTNYTPDTNMKIEQIFKDVALKSMPQTLLLEDIQFFDHDLKIEYQVQNRHFTMILGCNK